MQWRLLTNEQQKSYQNSKICYICKEKFEDKYDAANSIYNLKYGVPKKFLTMIIILS